MDYLNSKSFFVFSLILLLHLPYWVADGMVMDGLFYSCISRNLGLGIGTFLAPSYSPTMETVFHSHPPLVFWLQSILYKVFGDSIYVERFYCVMTTFISTYLIVKNWQLLVQNKVYSSFGWIIIILWVTTPIVFWGNRNNILDTSLSMFCLAAILFYVMSCKSRLYYLSILGFVFLVSAVLTKGPVGLFPLVVPLLYAILIDRTTIRFSIFLTMTNFLALSISFYLVCSYSKEAKLYLDEYLQKQIYISFSETCELAVDSRFYIFEALLSELVVSISLILVVLVFMKIKDKWRKAFRINNVSFFYLAIGLSASLPLIFSFKQFRFYLISSIPYFAIALGHQFLPIIVTGYSASKAKLNKFFTISSIVIMACAIVLGLYFFKKSIRDIDLISDVKILSEYLPRGTVLGCNDVLLQDYKLVSYLNRYGRIYLIADSNQKYTMFRKDGNNFNECENYEYILDTYVLKKNY